MTMKRLFVIAAVGLALGACASKPIYNVKHPVPLTAQTLPLDRIEATIIDAGQQRGWAFARVAPGHLEATQQQIKYWATVDIRFDQKTYEITHKASSGLKEQDGTIHRRYNTWVTHLERDIQLRLSQASLRR